MRCTKCSRPSDPETVVYAMHGACDLRPMPGFSGPCLAKIMKGQIDLDDGEDGHTIASTPVKRGNRRGRKQSSSDRK